MKRTTDRAILELLDGRSQAEIARIVGIASSTLAVRLLRMSRDGLVEKEDGIWRPAAAPLYVTAPDGDRYRVRRIESASRLPISGEGGLLPGLQVCISVEHCGTGERSTINMGAL